MQLYYVSDTLFSFQENDVSFLLAAGQGADQHLIEEQ